MGKPTTTSRFPAPGEDSLAFVFSRAGTPLLSPTEERAHGETIWDARRRLELLLSRARRQGLQQGPLPRVKTHRRPLSPEAVKRLLCAEREARRLESGSEGSRALRKSISGELRNLDQAKEALVRGNLRLVAWVAKKSLGRGLDRSDLFQEGAISLLEAVDRFDPARGTRLSTYATRAIQLGIVRALAEKGRLVRIPLHRLREVITASSAWSKLRSHLEREPTETEVSSLSGIHPDRLSELAPALRPVISADAPIPGTELPLSETIPDDSQSPFERAASSEAVELARKALASLPARERQILKLRYGIGVSDERSFEAIGKVVGLSRERSRQLERSALEKLRAALGARPARSDYWERRAS